VTFVFRRWL